MIFGFHQAGDYIDFACQTVDGQGQGYRNNIFSFQRYGSEIAFIIVMV